jgi:hypothetical protein
MPDTIGRLHPPRLAGAPASPANGEMYYDTGANILYWWNGSTWVSATGGSGGGGGAGHTIQNQGASLPARTNLNFKGAGVTTVDNSGANSSDVSIPALAVAARAYRNAAVSLPSGATWTKIAVDTTVFDTSGMVSIASGRIQVQTAGYYQVEGAWSGGPSGGATGECIAAIYKNGVRVTTGGIFAATSSGQDYGAAVADVVQCNAGDYLELYALQNSPGAVNTYTGNAASNYLSASLVSSISGTVSPVTQARAWRSAAYTLGTGWTKFPVDTIAYDPGACFNLANSRYTVPATGYYQCNAGFTVNDVTTTDSYVAAIYKNGTSAASGATVAANPVEAGATVSDIVFCNAGDYLEFWTYAAAKPIYPSSSGCYFSVSMVGQTTQLASGLTTGAVAARAYRSGAFTLTGGAQKIPLDAINYDTSGLVQLANNRIQIQTAGYYQIDAEVMAGSMTSGSMQIYVNRNGVEGSEGNIIASGSGGTGAVLSDTLQLNVGDYLELYVWTPGGTSQALSTTPWRNFLAVSMVSALPSSPAVTSAARAYRGAAYTIPASTAAAVPVDTISFDPAGNFSLSTNRYTCPVTGYYQCNFAIIGSASCLALLFKNGAQVATGSGVGTVNQESVGSDVIQCNAGDYLQLGAWNASTAVAMNIVGTWSNYLSVVQVGQQAQLQSGLTTGAIAARAYRSAALSVTASSWQKIPLDAASYDTSGLVSTANGRIQIQTAGYYHIEGSVQQAAAGQSIQIWVQKNGTVATVGTGLTSNVVNGTAVLSDVIQCNAGDYLELYVYSTIAGINPGAQQTFLAVSLVSSISAGVAPVTQARANRSAAFTLPASTNTKIPFDTVSFDPGGNFQLANGRYICPASGYYQVDGQINLSVGTGSIEAIIYKNGSQAATGTFATAYSSSVSDIIYCQAGDYLELWGYGTGGALQVATVTNYLSVSMVGQTGQFVQYAMNTAARAYRNAALTLSAGAYTKIPVDTVTYDAGSNLQIANGRYVCPTAGYYHVEGQVETNAASGSLLIAQINVNGAARTDGGRIIPGSGGAWAVTVSDVLQLSAGDYVELYAYSGVGDPLLTSSAFNYLSVVKVDTGGSPGAGWKTYNGSGTPTLAQVPGNNGDFCVRQSDGEVFQMVGGAWTDQGWSLAGANLNATSAARAWRNGAFSITAGTWTKIPVDTVPFDPGNHFGVSPSSYVCPVAGYYEVSGMVQVQPLAAATRVLAAIYKNGGNIAQGESDAVAGGFPAVVVSDIINCVAGDKLELWGYAGTTAPLQTGYNANYLSVSLVAATAVQQQPLQPASQAKAYRSAAFTQSTVNAWAKVPIDTVGFDAGGNVQIANNRYVCPTGGYYQVDAALAGYNSGGVASGYVGIYKNGTQWSALPIAAPVSGGTAYGEVSDQIQCNAGDYIELWSYCNLALTVVASPSQNYLSVSLIGTAPIAAPSYAARAYRNAAYTPPANTYTKIPVDTVSFDPSGCIQIANSRYVCPVAGVYAVDAEFGSSASATGTYTNVLVAIYKNGAMVSRAYSQPAVANYYGAAVSDKVQCNAGDYIELWCYSGQGTALDVGIPITENFLSVSLLTQAPAPLPVTTPLVSSSGLPSNPVDGQEFYFVADQTNGVVWHLKYRAASTSTHKWELVGGSDMQAGPSGSTGTSSTSAVALSGGPTITVPLPGDYDVTWGCFGQVTVSAQVNLQTAVGVNGALPTGWVAAQSVATALWGGGDMVREQVFANLTAAQVLSLMVWNNAANAANYANGWIKAKPRRVG